MPQVNARIDIKVGIQIQSRNWDERFTPTAVRNSRYHLVTDVAGSSAAIPEFCTRIFAEVSSSRDAGCVTYTHVGIRLDNATHPTTGKGVLPLAKGHLDGQLADGDFPDAMTLQTLLVNAVESMAGDAKYTA